MTPARIAVPPQARERVMLAGGIAPPAAPSFLDLAEAPAAIFKSHRSGDVGRIEESATTFGIALIRKRFWYPTWKDRVSGALRTTWLARSRVEREASNLERLADWGVQPRLFVAFGERRRCGFLVDSFLCTRELAARPLDELLRAERDPSRRDALLQALARFVARLHATGFADRDLHLRNLLATADGALAKIDSPFGRVVPRWRRRAAQQRDLADLRADLARVAAPDEVAAFELTLRAAASSCRG